MKHKLSHWFPASVKPVHVGVYEVIFSGWYAWWNGKRWGWSERSPKAAYRSRNVPYANQDKVWRGIVK